MSEPLARRSFFRNAAAAAAGLCGARSASGVDDDTQSPTDQLFELLKARFPDRLSDEEWKQIRSKIDGQLSSAKTLGEFKLKNSDEPATVFAAKRGA
jgi:hypothetical protein